MADHMTAEQLRAELERIARWLDGEACIVGDENGESPATAHDYELTQAAGALYALAARLSGMAADTWRPIETAPKDGTEVALLFATEADLPTGPAPRVRAARWIKDWSIPYYRDNPPIAWHSMPALPEPPHV